jgi:DUF4097 and DUF4098 domain-containing protein YvlB
MLEEGAISAEEAARLLEALSYGDKRKKHKTKIWNSLEGIPEVIATAIDTSTKFAESTETLTIAKKQHLEFKGISGDLSISGDHERDDIIIEKDGFTKVKEERDTIRLKALSGDITITTPRTIDLSLKGISGDLILHDIEGAIEIETVSGDISGSLLAGSIQGNIVSGDVELAYTKLTNMNIRSRSGNITIWLEDAIEAILDIHNNKGTIECEFDLTDEKRTKHSLNGIIGKAKTPIHINNKSGDITIRKLSSKSK